MCNFSYIGTELCNGTLQEYIDGSYKGGERFEDEKEILRQVTRGLAHLHEKKIVHRDIKPTNILIFLISEDRTKPVMKLADFGISKMLKSDKDDFTNTSVTNPNGTRGWMPPEVYELDRFEFSVDIWALGCIFAYILSGGKHPFGENADERIARIRKAGSMVLIKEDLKDTYRENPFVFELLKSML